MEDRLKAVETSAQRIDALLPHLATRADLIELRAELHAALNEQTWKFVGCVGAIAGLLLAGMKFLH